MTQSAGVPGDPGAGLAQDAGEDVELAAVAPGLSRELKRLLLLLAGASLIFGVLYLTPLGAIVSDIHQLRAFLRGDDLYAEMIYLALVILLVAVGMPRLLFYGLAGLAFGFWKGLILAQCGALAGSYITFYAVRHGGRDWLRKNFASHRFVGKAFHIRSSVKAVVLIRQLPLSSVMISSGLALSHVSAKVFLLGSFIGYLPQGVIAALIGSGAVDETALEGFSKLLVAGVVLMVGAFLLRRWSKREMRF
jgi:uncharacterized membrane protein YdjX (TVP38/TMEM64 family)